MTHRRGGDCRRGVSLPNSADIFIEFLSFSSFSYHYLRSISGGSALIINSKIETEMWTETVSLRSKPNIFLSH